jgi:hypothetical protein
MPSAARIVQTVCADTGVPAVANSAAISSTERSRARSSSTRSRTRSALRADRGPGFEERKYCALPARSSLAI